MNREVWRSCFQLFHQGELLKFARGLYFSILILLHITLIHIIYLLRIYTYIHTYIIFICLYTHMLLYRSLYISTYYPWRLRTRDSSIPNLQTSPCRRPVSLACRASAWQMQCCSLRGRNRTGCGSKSCGI